MGANEKSSRSFSISLYLFAFIITVLIFGIGIYVGLEIDKRNVSTISGDVENTLKRLESTQLLFLLDGSSDFCPVYADELSKLEESTESIGRKLAFLEDKQVVDEKLKLQYFVLETESYLLSKNVKEKCNDNSVLVLYFYSNKNCKDCLQQGEVLLNAKNRSKKRIKIYSFDGDLSSSVVEALKLKYSVSKYPSIVVDGKLYTEYKNVDEINQLLESS